MPSVKLPFHTLLLWSGLLCGPAAVANELPRTDVERFTVIVGDTRVGHLVASHDGNSVSIDYDYKNNGRGPTLTEVVQLDANGLPLRWRIDGSTTFGGKVEERFAIVDGRAGWTDSVGDGESGLQPARLYVAQGASPWALGLYARALLATPERTLPVLPGGSLSLSAGEPLQVDGAGGTLAVTSHALGGLELNPTYLLLDASRQLFALISPRFIVIREGYEEEEARLRVLAAELSSKRLEALQAELAHDFDAPVRIRNVRIFEPERLALSEPVSVLVHGRRISGVQPLDAPATPGEVLIDGDGGTLVPGLYEMHAHMSQDGALLNIAAGVTSMRDMGNNNEVLAQLIERIENGSIAGPRVIRSGFIEGRSPFNSNNGRLVDSEAAAVDAVRWYAARGFWQVKLYNSMNPAWIDAAVAEAHRLGLRISGHVPAFANADAMIDAGFDELTHINQIMLGWVLQPDEDTRTLLRLTALRRLPQLDLDGTRVQDTLRRIVERGVAVEPTIAIHEALLLNRDGEVPPGQVDYLDHMPVGVQRSARRGWIDLSEPGDDAAYRGAWQQVLALLRQMHERDVLLIPGTDLGGALTLHRELELFQQIGMSPAEVLRRATLEMAQYLGEEQQLGSIERGKLADFFLVPGDPTTDLAAIKRIRMVVSDGTFYFPEEIHPAFGIRPFAKAPAVQLPEGSAAGG